MRPAADREGVTVLTAVVVLALLSTCTGCATTFTVEAEHVSHPGAGWPCGPENEEDALTHVQAVLGWVGAGGVGPYLQAGVGANLQGSNGAGFYGPTVTGTLRAGYTWRLRR